MGSTVVAGTPSSAFNRFVTHLQFAGTRMSAIDHQARVVRAVPSVGDEEVVVRFTARGDSTTIAAQGVRGGMQALILGLDMVREMIDKPGPVWNMPDEVGAYRLTSVRQLEPITAGIRYRYEASGATPSYHDVFVWMRSEDTLTEVQAASAEGARHRSIYDVLVERQQVQKFRVLASDSSVLTIGPRNIPAYRVEIEEQRSNQMAHSHMNVYVDGRTYLKFRATTPVDRQASSDVTSWTIALMLTSLVPR